MEYICLFKMLIISEVWITKFDIIGNVTLYKLKYIVFIYLSILICIGNYVNTDKVFLKYWKHLL